MNKVLNKLIENIAYSRLLGNTEKEISDIVFDSRQVKQNSLFVAVRGAAADGHRFIPMAVEKGAVAVLAEELPGNAPEGVTYILVADTREALAGVASAFYGYPSQKLALVGVTGTNGKTTIASLLYQLFYNEGYCSGLLATIGVWIDDEEVPATLTTPDVVTINRLLAQMVKKGCTHCFMEVSSHAVVQKRVHGLHFSGGIFTNISHDHLDYHKTFQNYLNAKKGFFDMLPQQAFALTNSDHKNGAFMLQNTRAARHSYGLHNVAGFRARVMETHKEGMILMMDNQEVATRFIGDFNAYNLLAVYATARLLNIPHENTLEAISELWPVRGRLETLIAPNGLTAVIDYAHTPDALENLFQAVAGYRSGNEMLISLAGAGGDRDKTKRPLMAAIVARYADKLILTSDNPRSEEPGDIIDDMEEGVPFEHRHKVMRITSREEAIRTAVTLAGAQDILVVPGKGHETYQEINGVRYHFDDREILLAAFDKMEHTNEPNNRAT